MGVLADFGVERLLSSLVLGGEGPVMMRRSLRDLSACWIRLARESESVLQESISTSSLDLLTFP